MKLLKLDVRRAAVAIMTATVVLLPARVFGQVSTTRGLSLGAHLQATSLTVEDGEANPGGGLGLRVGYGLNRRLTLFLHLDGSQIDVPTGNGVLGEWGLAHAELGARFHFANSLRRWVPYIEASGGSRAVSIDEATFNGQGAGKVSFNGGALTFGTGISTYVRNNLAIDVSLKWTGGTFTEVDLGNVALQDIDIDASSFRLGVGLIWWK